MSYICICNVTDASVTHSVSKTKRHSYQISEFIILVGFCCFVCQSQKFNDFMTTLWTLSTSAVWRYAIIYACANAHFYANIVRSVHVPSSYAYVYMHLRVCYLHMFELCLFFSLCVCYLHMCVHMCICYLRMCRLCMRECIHVRPPAPTRIHVKLLSRPQSTKDAAKSASIAHTHTRETCTRIRLQHEHTRAHVRTSTHVHARSGSIPTRKRAQRTH